jgi:phage replication-related protein YjqB (UPF0714/DUF867 family)
LHERGVGFAALEIQATGAMALGAHGYERVTVDVDGLLTREGLARFKREQLVELIRAAKLPAELAASLNPYVREKYEELWRAAQIEDPE